MDIEPLPEGLGGEPRDWLLELDERLPADCWLGGWSLGGLVAWMYARKHFLCLRAADARLLLPEPAILKALKK